MAFIFHVAMLLALIALSAGMSLIIKVSPNQEAVAAWAKFVGIIIIITTVLNFFCISYYGIKYWNEGYFQSPTGIHMMQGNPMTQQKHKVVPMSEQGHMSIDMTQ